MLVEYLSANMGSIIDGIAITLSFISFIYVLLESNKSGAPFLIADRAILNLDNREKKMKFADGLPETKGAECILDCRGFTEIVEGKKSKPKIEPSVLSLILDSRGINKSKSDVKVWCRFCSVSLRNSGMDMISLQLYKTRITFPDTRVLILSPNQDHNNILHIYLKTGETVVIDMSFIFNTDENQLIRIMKDSKDWENRLIRLAEIKSNILDAHVPIILDAYTKIEYFIKTTNMYNKNYYQTISYIVGPKQYSTTSKKLNRYLQIGQLPKGD